MSIDGPIVRWVLSAGLLAATAAMAQAETIRCTDGKDVLGQRGPQGSGLLDGRTDRIELKVLQEFGLIAFDVAALKGRQIRWAELYLYPAGSEQKPLVADRGTNLRWITVSTVSSHWVEGEQAEAYKTDPAGHGATYNEASYQRKSWAWKGSPLSFVINGHLNSLVSVGELVKADGGYWKVPVDAKVVQALAAGLGDGLAIMDGSSTHTINEYVYSRESKGHEPYLLVEVGAKQTQAPKAPRVAAVEPDPGHATPDAGALRIRIRPEVGTLGYLVKVDGKQMEPWQVALPHAQYDEQVRAGGGDSGSHAGPDADAQGPAG